MPFYSFLSINISLQKTSKLLFYFILTPICFLLVSCNYDNNRKNKTNYFMCKSGELTNENISIGIIGGKSVDSSSWMAKSVVYLHVNLERSNEDINNNVYPYSMCTGSLISKNIILTAAHCLKDVNPDYKNLKVYFTNKLVCETEETVNQITRYSDKVEKHPQYDDKKQVNDIALIRLSAPAPQDSIPLPLSVEYIDPTGKQILIGGFGLIDESKKYSFENVYLRSAFLSLLKEETISKITDTHFDKNLSSLNEEEIIKQKKSFKESFYPAADKEEILMDQSEGKGACFGDSGGAAFIYKNAQMNIIGIATGVNHIYSKSELENHKKKNKEPARCNQLSIYTSTYFHKEWLSQTIKKMNQIPF